MSQAAHARTIPSFLAKLVAKPFTEGNVTVSIESMFGPGAEVIEDETCKQKILKQVSQKYSTHREWAMHNLRPVDWHRARHTWDQFLNPHERSQIQILIQIHGESFLESCSGHELRIAMGMLLSPFMCLLAKIEASYWGEGDYEALLMDLPNRVKGSQRMEKPTQLIKVDDELKLKIQMCLNLPWVHNISDKDLRFGSEKSHPVAQLNQALQSRICGKGVSELAERILAANQYTLEDEIRDVAYSSYPEGKTGRVIKWVDLIMRRYACDRVKTVTSTVKEIRQAGDDRVSQGLYSSFSNRLKMYGKDTSMPTLEKVLDELKRMAPISVDDANEALRTMLGGNTGVLSALSIAHDSHKDLRGMKAVYRSYQKIKCLCIIDSTRKNVPYKPKNLGPNSDPALILAPPPEIGLVKQEISRTGLARLESLHERLLAEGQTNLSLKELRDAVKCLDGYQELDASGFFITCHQTFADPFFRAAHQIVLSAKKEPKIDVLVKYVRSFTKASRRDHVWYRKVFQTWDSLKLEPNDTLKVSPYVYESDCFDAAELNVLQTLQKFGGVACASDIEDALTDAHCIVDKDVWSNYPFITAHNPDIFVLRSWPVLLKPLDGARLRHQRASTKRTKAITQESNSIVYDLPASV